MIKAVVFDFGGVIAEEGFREGLRAIAKNNGVEAEEFFRIAENLIYQTGYVIGAAKESEYWRRLREATGVSGTNRELREEILSRFVLRPQVLAVIEELRNSGIMVAILSDQTNWLGEIERRTPFSHLFHKVFNSYELKKSKRTAFLFREVCAMLGLAPEEVLFVDDNIGNISRAAAEGLETVLFREVADLEERIGGLIPSR